MTCGLTLPVTWEFSWGFSWRIALGMIPQITCGLNHGVTYRMPTLGMIRLLSGVHLRTAIQALSEAPTAKPRSEVSDAMA